MTPLSRIISVVLSLTTVGIAVRCPALATDKATLKILYPENAPFISGKTLTSTPSGPIATRISSIAAKANIDIIWEGPVARGQLLERLLHGEYGCMANALITDERKKFYRFTQPIFQPPTWRVVSRSKAFKRKYESLDVLLADDSVVFGALLGASMGPKVDQVASSGRTNVRLVRGSPEALLKLIALGRVDYTIADAGEVVRVASQIGVEPTAFDIVDLPGLPVTPGGGIMCATSVPVEIIAQFDKAIAALPQAQ